MIPPSALRLLVDVFPAPTEQARAIGLFIGSSSVGVGLHIVT